MEQKRIEYVTIGNEKIDVHRMGDPSAPVLLFSHSLSSSGEEGMVVLGKAAEQGFQVVAPTRPGYGNSTIKVHKNLKQITEDQLRILDRLGIRDKIYAVGTSAGAKSALSIANQEPDRVKGISLLAGLPPFEDDVARANLPFGMRLGLSAVNMLPRQAWPFFSWLTGMAEVRKARKNPEQAIRNYIKILPFADQQILSQPEMFESFVNIVRDWSRPGTGCGMFSDITRAANPWEFDPADVTKDVQIIHGTLDHVVPYDAAMAFKKIPNHEVATFVESGHAIYAYPEVSQLVIDKAKKVFGL